MTPEELEKFQSLILGGKALPGTESLEVQRKRLASVEVECVHPQTPEEADHQFLEVTGYPDTMLKVRWFINNAAQMWNAQAYNGAVGNLRDVLLTLTAQGEEVAAGRIALQLAAMEERLSHRQEMLGYLGVGVNMLHPPRRRRPFAMEYLAIIRASAALLKLRAFLIRTEQLKNTSLKKIAKPFFFVASAACAYAGDLTNSEMFQNIRSAWAKDGLQVEHRQTPKRLETIDGPIRILEQRLVTQSAIEPPGLRAVWESLTFTTPPVRNY